MDYIHNPAPSTAPIQLDLNMNQSKDSATNNDIVWNKCPSSMCVSVIYKAVQVPWWLGKNWSHSLVTHIQIVDWGVAPKVDCIMDIVWVHHML